MKNTHCRFPDFETCKASFLNMAERAAYSYFENHLHILFQPKFTEIHHQRYKDTDLCCSHPSIWCYIVSETWWRYVERSVLCAPSRDHIELAYSKADQLARSWIM